MRHASAETVSQFTDQNRPLSLRGQKEQKSMALLLKNQKIQLETVFYSPFLRTTQSAQILRQEFSETQFVKEALLGDYFDSELLLINLQKSSSKNILLLGHEPSLVLLLHKFLTKPAVLKLSTSSIVQIKFTKNIEWGDGELVNYFCPEKDLNSS